MNSLSASSALELVADVFISETVTAQSDLLYKYVKHLVTFCDTVLKMRGRVRSSCIDYFILRQETRPSLYLSPLRTSWRRSCLSLAWRCWSLRSSAAAAAPSTTSPQTGSSAYCCRRRPCGQAWWATPRRAAGPWRSGGWRWR